MKKEALLYEKTKDKSVRCFLCSHRCQIADGKSGFCRVRQNAGGILYSQVYGRPCALHVDPIEKKPLYHFLPGSHSFSVATPGCNFRCGFCQNWEISQADAASGIELGQEVLPEAIAEEAAESGCKSISYTYTEPTIFFEYALDIARLARTKGLKNVFVTNGYMTKECILEIKPYLDAANVDLKFFKDSSYKKICGGSLEPVLATIRLMKELGIWVEVTTLLVPGENDSDEELEDIAGFISGIDKDIPWHVSRFHPDYKFNNHKATPEAALKKAEEIGSKAGLGHIYIGNVAGWGNDTYCRGCRQLLIKREIFSILENNIKQGRCPSCGEHVPGIFDAGR